MCYAKLTLLFFSDSCGGWLKALTGQFHSPGFPQSYAKDMNCVWVIEVPISYYIILDFVSLVIEEHRNCEYDYVMVYDGMESDQRVLGRYGLHINFLQFPYIIFVQMIVIQ